MKIKLANAILSQLSLLLLLLLLLIGPRPVKLDSSTSRAWIRGFDNLSDYQQTSVRVGVATVRLCLAEVSAAAHLVTFAETNGTCREFRCLLGQSSCRKCRSSSLTGQGAANLAEVWTPKSLAAFCWLTVQHRVSDSVDFNRNWTQYRAGFGEGPAGNFWIGLDSLHSLTSPPNNERKLRVLMKSWNSTAVWVEYSNFVVGPESTNYQMNVSSEYSTSESGNWDALSYGSGQGFSTPEVNNDVCGNRAYNCAGRFNQGWWFKCCSRVYPNGRFYNYPEALSVASWSGVAWVNGFGAEYSLMEFEMLIA